MKTPTKAPNSTIDNSIDNSVTGDSAVAGATNSSISGHYFDGVNGMQHVANTSKGATQEAQPISTNVQCHVIDAMTPDAGTKEDLDITPDTSHPTGAMARDGVRVGTFVVVNYDRTFYPGIVLDIDNFGICVKCMTPSRRNDGKFFWPSSGDICWYTCQDIIYTLIDLPTNVRSLLLNDKPYWF